MLSIMKREFSSYFHSPIGYIFLAAFYTLAGIYFFFGALIQFTSDMTQMFDSLFSMSLILIPILTMRLLSEERKHKTDQLLLTAPVSLTGLVLGKFFSAVLVYQMGLSVTLLYGIVFSFYTTPDWALLFGNYIALTLLGMALIAVGLFISSLTESQVAAATGSFAVSLVLLLIDAMRGVFQSPVLNSIIVGLSFYDRYSDFAAGILNITNILFFLSIATAFLFLTVRVFDKRRWG